MEAAAEGDGSSKEASLLHLLRADALHDPKARDLAAAAGLRQPRGWKIPETITEFQCIFQFPLSQVFILDSKKCLRDPLGQCPAGAKFIGINKGETTMRLTTSTASKVRFSQEVTHSSVAKLFDKVNGGVTKVGFGSLTLVDESWVVLFGCFRSPERWHHEASCLIFPPDSVGFLRPLHAKAIWKMFGMSPAQLSSFRRDMVEKLVMMRRKLNRAEMDLHDKMPNHVRRVMKGKSILLLEELAQQVGVGEPWIFEGLKSGFMLSGSIPATSLFPLHESLATKSRLDLLSESCWRVPSIVQKTRSCGDVELDRRLVDKTLEEKLAGYLDGPYNKKQLDSRFGVHGWVAAKRFLVLQSSPDGEKLRPIDDFTINGQNATVSVNNRLDHGGIEELVAIGRLIQYVITPRKMNFVDLSGKRWTGQVHPGWYAQDFVLKGRALDLKSAYKQLAVHPDDLCLAISAVHEPGSSTPTYWISQGLPFGSVASVYHFNACSRLLEVLASELFLLVSTSYFDDYPAIEPSITSVSSRVAMESMLTILGWRYATEGGKYHDFEEEFQVLGVKVSFERLRLKVENAESRLNSLGRLVGDFLECNRWDWSKVESLLGRCAFARTFVEGRPLHPAMATLWDALAKKDELSDFGNVRAAVELIGKYVKQCKPKIFEAGRARKMAILYTDGSCEDNFAGIGAVLFSESKVEVIEEQLPPPVMECWSRLGIKHAIAQVELVSVWLALKTWASALSSCDLLIFTDNVSVKEGLVKGTSTNLVSRILLFKIAALEVALGLRVWISRVPSKSNPADGPSRGDLSELRSWTTPTKVNLEWDPLIEELAGPDVMQRVG